MKKWIFLLGASLILTGCSTTGSVTSEVQKKGLYINDDMKKIIKDINDLNDKYSKDMPMDNRYYDSLYIDMDSNIERIKNISFDRHTYGDEYFKKLVQILDKGLAEGLEDYVLDMKDKRLEPDETIVEKIGRTIVYIQNRGGNEGNYMSINVDFLDLEDDYYRDRINKISNGKYILDNFITGEKLDLLEFLNFSNSNYRNDYNNVGIRYSMFFKDEDIEKVNILIQRKKESEFKDDDMEVFINLLNSLELKEGEKDLLVEKYKNIFEKKVNKRKINLDNYKLLINPNKGNFYSGKNKQLIYFSIERN